MKQCITFPEDRFLAVRPCLVAICGGNRAAGKLLGVLLYRYNLRIENRDDAKTHNDIKISQGEIPDQDISFSIYRKQWQLVVDLCDELSEKTIHDIAIPWLQLLGYLDIEEFQGGNRYDVNLEQIKQVLSLYEPEKKEQVQIEKFLIANLQLEKFLINIQLENFLIDRKTFLLLLEKVLIANRKVSHCQRGRKHRSDAPSDGETENPKNIEEDSKKSNKESTLDASASTRTHFIRNEFGELIEVPADLAEKALASQRKVLDLPEPNLPIDFLETKRRKTDPQLQAMKGQNDDSTIPAQPLLDQPTRSTTSDSMDAGSDMPGLRDIGNGGQLAQPQAPNLQIDSSHSHVDIGNDEELDDVPTVKMQAIPKGQGDVSVDNRDHLGDATIDTPGVQDERRAERARTPEALEALGLEKGQAHVDYSDSSGDTLPAHSDIHAGTLQSSGEPQGRLEQTPGAGDAHFSPADTPPSVSTGDTTSVQALIPGTQPARQAGAVPDTLVKAGAAQVKPVPKSDTREIQRRINEHRGYALEEKVEILRERTAIKAWCHLHTLEEYEQVMLKLKSDPYWGKSVNYYRIGGLTLAKETPKKLAKAPPHREQDEDSTVISFDDYVGNGPEAREAILLEYEEHRKNGTLAW